MQKEQVIVISETPYSIESSAESGVDSTLESGELSCIFSFKYIDSASSEAIILLIKNMICEFLKDSNLVIKYKDSIESKKEQIFSIFMHAKSSDILALSNMLSSIPIALNFKFISLDLLDSNSVQNYDDFKDFSDKIMESIPSIKELDSIKKSYDISKFIEIKYPKYESFKDLIYDISNLLIKDSKIIIRRNNEVFMLSTKAILSEDSMIESKSEIPQIIFTDLYNAISYLRLSDAQKSMLASLEAPFILLQVKSAFASLFTASKAFCTLPNDCFLMLLLQTLQSAHSIDFVFFKSLENLDSKKDSIMSPNSQNYALYYITKPEIIMQNLLHFKPKIIASKESNLYVNFSYKKGDFFSLLSENKRVESKRFIICLSRENKSAFWIENMRENNEYNEILSVKFSLDLRAHLKALYHYKNGDKLLKNFAKQNEKIVQSWGINFENLDSKTFEKSQNMESKNIESTNLCDIFTLIKQLLNLQKDVLEYASECVRDRGPRIDFKLTKSGDSITLDYPRILRSCLSFYLAGVEIELICYGVVESLCEFIGTLCGDMFVNYGVREVFACGDMLLEQNFFDKIIYAIPKNLNLTLPHNAVDYRI